MSQTMTPLHRAVSSRDSQDICTDRTIPFPKPLLSGTPCGNQTFPDLECAPNAKFPLLQTRVDSFVVLNPCPKPKKLIVLRSLLPTCFWLSVSLSPLILFRFYSSSFQILPQELHWYRDTTSLPRSFIPHVSPLLMS
jgi:hypothetical protein